MSNVFAFYLLCVYIVNMKKNKKNYTFRFDPEMIDKVEEVAKREKRSRTNMIEVMVDAYLEKSDPGYTDQRPSQ